MNVGSKGHWIAQYIHIALSLYLYEAMRNLPARRTNVLLIALEEVASICALVKTMSGVAFYGRLIEV